MASVGGFWWNILTICPEYTFSHHPWWQRFITVTSYECHGVLSHRRLDFFKSLYADNGKPQGSVLLVTGGLPSQSVSNAECIMWKMTSSCIDALFCCPCLVLFCNAIISSQLFKMMELKRFDIGWNGTAALYFDHMLMSARYIRFESQYHIFILYCGIVLGLHLM